jgi:hypothetical protein
MYLFTRRTRLARGHGRAGLEWAHTMTELANQNTGLDVRLWATVFSEGAGTVSWSAFAPDLTTLETGGDKLEVDNVYQAEIDMGAALTEGGLDDSLVEVIHGEPNPQLVPEYVSSVQSACLPGQFGVGFAAAIEIAEKAEAITGHTTLVVRNVTGPYAGVGWLSGSPDIATLEADAQALNADPSWVPFIDERATVFDANPAATAATIHRRLA